MCILFHKFGNYKVTRRGSLGKNFENGKIIDMGKGNARTTISPSGDFITQERQCVKCGYIEIDRTEVFGN